MMHREPNPSETRPGSEALPFGAGALPAGDVLDDSRGAPGDVRQASAGDQVVVARRPEAGASGVAHRALAWAQESDAAPIDDAEFGSQPSIMRAAIGVLAAHDAPGKWRPGILPGAASTQASLARAVAAASSDPGFGGGARMLVRPHWSEALATVVGRVVVARLRGARVLLAVHGALLPLAEDLADALGGDDGGIQVVEDPGLDAVRALASDVDVELDVFAPELDGARLGSALLKSRRETRRRGGGEVQVDSAATWFGAGLLERPFAPIRVRASAAPLALVGPGLESLEPLADLIIPADSGSDSDDVEAAALMVAEGAFGPGALGGYGALALGRVVIAPALYSAFTGALLDRLAPPAGAERPDWLIADGAALPRSLDDAVLAARRTALDEGGTLILERRGRGARRVVFANVEARMQLGAGRGAPCLLALMRGTDATLGTLGSATSPGRSR